MDNYDTPLTHDEHKEVSADMLVETKDLTTNTIKIIGEGFQNENKNLDTILFTLVSLSTFGLSYFKGNFADRGRYESLICPFWIFFDMIIGKLKELNYILHADNLLENKEEFIEFLKDTNWLLSDMTNQWTTDEDNDHFYGKITNKKLRKAKGIRISPKNVFIANFNEWGNAA